MGGASAWHFGAHFAGLWAAVAPGAGFSETTEFLHTDRRDAAARVGAEALAPLRRDRLRDQSLQRAHGAYNGEIDPQKQAGRRDGEGDGRRGHAARARYRPARRRTATIPIRRWRSTACWTPIAERGRDPWPRKVRSPPGPWPTTSMKWLTIDGMAQALGARAPGCRNHAATRAVNVTSANVTAFTLEFGPGGCPLDLAHAARGDRSTGRSSRRRSRVATAPGWRISARSMAAVDGRGWQARRPACTRSRPARPDRRRLPG